MKKQKKVLKYFAITVAILFMVFAFTGCPTSGGSGTDSGDGSNSNSETDSNSGSGSGSDSGNDSSDSNSGGGNGSDDSTDSNLLTVTFTIPDGMVVENASEFPKKITVKKGEKIAAKDMPYPIKSGHVAFDWYCMKGSGKTAYKKYVTPSTEIEENLTVIASMCDGDYIMYEDVPGGCKIIDQPSSVVNAADYKYAWKIARYICVPDQHDGKDVVEIDAAAFHYEMGSIYGIKLGNKIKKIGNVAFETELGTSCVKELVIPASVKTIGAGAFHNLNIQKLVLNEGLESIGARAFKSNGMPELTIPNSCTSLGEEAFAKNKLQKLTIGTGIKVLEVDTFLENKELTEITIPNSCTEIGEGCFVECEKLESITLPNKLESIGKKAFSHCKGLKSIVIPDTCTILGEYCFYKCKALESVTLGTGVEKVYNYAFCDIAAKNITIPGTITAIGQSAFYVNYDGTNQINMTVTGISSKPANWNPKWYGAYDANGKKIKDQTKLDEAVKVTYQP